MSTKRITRSDSLRSIDEPSSLTTPAGPRHSPRPHTPAQPQTGAPHTSAQPLTDEPHTSPQPHTSDPPRVSSQPPTAVLPTVDPPPATHTPPTGAPADPPTGAPADPPTGAPTSAPTSAPTDPPTLTSTAETREAAIGRNQGVDDATADNEQAERKRRQGQAPVVEIRQKGAKMVSEATPAGPSREVTLQTLREMAGGSETGMPKQMAKRSGGPLPKLIIKRPKGPQSVTATPTAPVPAAARPSLAKLPGRFPAARPAAAQPAAAQPAAAKPSSAKLPPRSPAKPATPAPATPAPATPGFATPAPATPVRHHYLPVMDDMSYTSCGIKAEVNWALPAGFTVDPVYDPINLPAYYLVGPQTPDEIEHMAASRRRWKYNGRVPIFNIATPYIASPTLHPSNAQHIPAIVRQVEYPTELEVARWHKHQLPATYFSFLSGGQPPDLPDSLWPDAWHGHVPAWLYRMRFPCEHCAPRKFPCLVANASLPDKDGWIRPFACLRCQKRKGGCTWSGNQQMYMRFMPGHFGPINGTVKLVPKEKKGAQRKTVRLVQGQVEKLVEVDVSPSVEPQDAGQLQGEGKAAQDDPPMESGMPPEGLAAFTVDLADPPVTPTDGQQPQADQARHQAEEAHGTDQAEGHGMDRAEDQGMVQAEDQGMVQAEDQGMDQAEGEDKDQGGDGEDQGDKGQERQGEDGEEHEEDKGQEGAEEDDDETGDDPDDVDEKVPPPLRDKLAELGQEFAKVGQSFLAQAAEYAQDFTPDGGRSNVALTRALSQARADAERAETDLEVAMEHAWLAKAQQWGDRAPDETVRARQQKTVHAARFSASFVVDPAQSDLRHMPALGTVMVSLGSHLTVAPHEDGKVKILLSGNAVHMPIDDEYKKTFADHLIPFNVRSSADFTPSTLQRDTPPSHDPILQRDHFLQLLPSELPEPGPKTWDNLWDSQRCIDVLGCGQPSDTRVRRAWSEFANQIVGYLEAHDVSLKVESLSCQRRRTPELQHVHDQLQDAVRFDMQRRRPPPPWITTAIGSVDVHLYDTLSHYPSQFSSGVWMWAQVIEGSSFLSRRTWSLDPLPGRHRIVIVSSLFTFEQPSSFENSADVAVVAEATWDKWLSLDPWHPRYDALRPLKLDDCILVVGFVTVPNHFVPFMVLPSCRAIIMGEEMGMERQELFETLFTRLLNRQLEKEGLSAREWEVVWEATMADSVGNACAPKTALAIDRAVFEPEIGEESWASSTLSAALPSSGVYDEEADRALRIELRHRLTHDMRVALTAPMFAKWDPNDPLGL